MFIRESDHHYSVDGFVTVDEIINHARQLLVQSLRLPGEAFTDPDKVRQFLELQLVHQEREVFACLFLDNRNRLIEYRELFFGTIDGASVHPREVVKVALQLNAAAVILAHNHPSGVAEPSGADRQITQRIKNALALIDVRTLDHFIVGHGDLYSFAEYGLL
ncbi:DNA repair protein RadC [Magnetovirga frankeli]|uniref:RadC family protein n=1 Tax=Magnetovirga frankeli TaxID=947516 RepID=UPI001292E56B|nr:DNA repair protein RadC [gamma proteobacterium SS-5]